MKLLKLLLIVVFFVDFASANAQTDEQKKAKARQQDAVANYKANKQVKPVKMQSSAGTPAALDENDPYMGRSQEFLSRLTVTELPKDFPKYDKSYGISGYNDVVDNYYKSHGSIVKDWVKQKLNIQ